MGKSHLSRFLLSFFVPHPSKKTQCRALRNYTASWERGDSSKSAYATNFCRVFQECAKKRAPLQGKQAHSCMIVSGFCPTIFVSNCLIQMYINCKNLVYAYKVFDRMPLRDVVSWNSMIFGHASRGDMGAASMLFEAMAFRDVVSWNSMISGYLQNNELLKSIEVFVEMGRSGMGFDNKTIAVILKVCSCLDEDKLGIQVHGLAVRIGYDNDVVTGSALLDMYAKCQRLSESFRLFYEMLEKNWVCWSAIIGGCVQNNLFAKGVELFKEMQRAHVEVSQSVYASVFRSCAGLSILSLGTQLHAHALKMDFGSDSIVKTGILDMYAKCSSMIDAQKLFNKSQNLVLQSYNAMIVGYVQNSQGYKSLLLFRLLLRSGLGFDEISLSGAFSACALAKGILEGLQIHCLAIKSSFRRNLCVGNAIIDMYGKCSSPTEAFSVFNEMECRDYVSWNAIIAAFEQNNKEAATLAFFVEMLRSSMEPDEFTFGSVLKACAGSLNYGLEVHTRTIKSGMSLNSFVGSSLVDMYSRYGMLEEAEKLHNRLFLKSNSVDVDSKRSEIREDSEKIHEGREDVMTVSWNSIISGFIMHKQSEDALRIFNQMLEVGVTPDMFTYATVLDACANLASIGLGQQIHAQIIKQELQFDVYICSTLVDMYSKCGNMQDSKLMFEKATNRDFVTWNAMISGYANHGQGEEALKTFENMMVMNIMPNHATFVSVLRACAHMGFVERGQKYFDAMRMKYGLVPQLEHYSCMVDILGRSGKVHEALKFIHEMPFEADDVIWRTLLSNCKMHENNIEVAEEAANALLQLDPQDSSAYILLSNIYAHAGMWSKVAELRKSMKCDKMKKEPGCSWVEIRDEIHLFLVGDKVHPRYKEMYGKLALLYDEMNWVGYYGSDVQVLLDRKEEHQHQEAFETRLYGVL